MKKFMISIAMVIFLSTLVGLGITAAKLDKIPTVGGSYSYYNIYDEDDMSSNSATGVATQQSTKAYCDSGMSGITLGGATALYLEGATADAYETALAVTVPTADRTMTVPNASGAIILSTGGVADTANAISGGTGTFIFEGSTANGYETTIGVTDPTADRTITFSDQSGVPILSAGVADVAHAITGGNSLLLFECTSADDYELTLTVADATADRTVTLPDASGHVIVSSAGAAESANAISGGTGTLVWEGASADDFETSLAVTDATADRTITLPDASGVPILSAGVADVAHAITGGNSLLLFEGTTADDYETTLTVADTTSSDKTVTLPDQTGTVLLSVGGAADTANAISGGTGTLIFEGSSADDYETTLAVTNTTSSDKTVTLPDQTGTVIVSAAGAADTANAISGGTGTLVFEGSSADDYETSIAVTDPTADRTVTLPNVTGTVVTTGNLTDITDVGALTGDVDISGNDVDVTLAVDSTGGNAGVVNEFVGVPKIRLRALGILNNADQLKGPYTDDTPAGEWTAHDADCVVSTDTSYYKVGSASLKLAFTDTAADGDGATNALGGGDEDWSADESVGFWIYSDTALSDGDMCLAVTDNATDDETTTIGAVSANVWTWVELEIGSIADADKNVVTDIKLEITAQGEAALGAFNVYFDTGYKWDGAQEIALGVDVLTDGVMSVVTITDAQDQTNTTTNIAEYTDYFVHYETGNDFILLITDQSAESGTALVALEP